MLIFITNRNMLSAIRNTTTVQVIRNFLYYSVVKNEPKMSLGRWKLSYNNGHIDNRVDRANEDHCGPCGELYLNKSKK